MKKLPAKSEIREAPNKKLAAAILTTFMRKEHAVAIYLKNLLQKSGIDIPVQENSPSTCDMTGSSPAIPQDEYPPESFSTRLSTQQSAE